MPKPGKTGATRIIHAFGYALLGLKAAFKNEASFRQELLLAAFMIPAGIYLGADPLEKALLVAVVLLVLIIELLNSALEAIVDRIGGEYHELAGRAKDMGAAAVFISLILVVSIWLIILYPTTSRIFSGSPCPH